jgi:hypothetical protein
MWSNGIRIKRKVLLRGHPLRDPRHPLRPDGLRWRPVPVIKKFVFLNISSSPERLPQGDLAPKARGSVRDEIVWPTNFYGIGGEKFRTYRAAKPEAALCAQTSVSI